MAEANLNYQAIRITHQAREADDQRIENRKRNLIILILQWLTDEGYIESARQLEQETNLDVSKYDVCDNVDLNTILQEYESYFYVKFNRYPKLTKKNGPSTAAFMSKISAKMSNAQSSTRRNNLPSLPRVLSNASDPSSGSSTRLPSAGDSMRRIASTGKSNPQNSERTNIQSSPASSNIQRQNSTQQSGNSSNTPSTNSLEDMSLSFMKVSSVKSIAVSNEQQNGNKKKIVDCRGILNDTIRGNVADNIDPSERLLKPLGGFIGYSSEWRELAEVISRVKKIIN